jgi:uncharacterized membrane protein
MTLSMLGAAHGAAAIAALVFGSIVLMQQKGTPAHRALGAAFVAAMIATNLTALGVYRITGQFGPFHALALVSLVTVARGVIVALRRRPGWLVTHYYCMAWSYVALLSAAAAEAIARAPLLAGVIQNGRDGMVVGLACVAVFLVAGFVAIPRLQARTLAGVGER